MTTMRKCYSRKNEHSLQKVNMQPIGPEQKPSARKLSLTSISCYRRPQDQFSGNKKLNVVYDKTTVRLLILIF